MKHLKEEFDKLTLKEVLAYTLAYLSMIAGFVLLYLAMYIDPEGEIHPSVLSAFGMVGVMSSGFSDTPCTSKTTLRSSRLPSMRSSVVSQEERRARHEMVHHYGALQERDGSR